MLEHSRPQTLDNEGEAMAVSRGPLLEGGKHALLILIYTPSPLFQGGGCEKALGFSRSAFIELALSRRNFLQVCTTMVLGGVSCIWKVNEAE